MRKDNLSNPRVITFLNPHIYVSRPYHKIFNEKSIWICKMRTGFLQGRGETPKQAYDSWAKLHLNYYSNKYERLGKDVYAPD